MFIEQGITAIVFRLLNFGILIGLALYIFKKYGLSIITQLIAKKESYYAHLLEQKFSFAQRYADLKILFHKDIQQSERVKKNIESWNISISQEHEMLMKEYARYHAQACENKNRRAELSEYRKTTQIVTDRVSDKLTQDLSTHFESEQANAEYINAIVNFMKKKV
jgi:hypothetical protein